MLSKETEKHDYDLFHSVFMESDYVYLSTFLLPPPPNKMKESDNEKGK